MTTVVSLVVTLAAALAVAGGTAGGGGWPLVPSPPVVRGFDPPQTAWGSGHRGVDLLGHRGEPVRAARAGRITFAGRLVGRGVVVVDHGGLRTTYEPVAAAVHVGEHVARGQRIGTLQVGGSHCFPRACLHWGLLHGETYLDPLLLVGAGPVRLLPLPGAGPVRLPPVPGATPATGRAPPRSSPARLVAGSELGLRGALGAAGP